MKINLYFLAVVVATGAISSTVLFADQGAGVTYGVRNDDPYQVRDCFALDANGNAQGDPVKDSICHAGYAVSIYYGANEDHYCVNVDSNGLSYGQAVDNSLCHAGYAVGTQGPEDLKNCFNVDAKGQVYGDPVDPSNCSAGKYVVSHYEGAKEAYYCVNADSNGVGYGKAVDSSLCRVGYGLGDAGAACFSKDAKGQLFGDPVSSSLCSSK